MKVVRRVVIGLGGAGGATVAAVAVMKIYEQQADNAKKLPEVSGSGRVRNLREAISRYSTLNEYRLPPGSGNGGFIAGAKHTWGPAHE